MDNDQESIEPIQPNPYPDMRKKPNKAQYKDAGNRNKVVPRNPTKSHPASMKPQTKKGA